MLVACSIDTCTVPPVAESSVSLVSSVINGRLNFALTATIDWVSWLHDSTAPSVRLLVVLRSNLTQQTLNQCKVTRTIVIQNIVITQVAGERKIGRGRTREGRERARSSYFLLYKNNHALQDAVSLKNFFNAFQDAISLNVQSIFYAIIYRMLSRSMKVARLNVQNVFSDWEEISYQWM